MPAATRRKIEADTPETRRYRLAASTLRKWRTLTGMDNGELSELAHMDPGTFSTAAAGRYYVSEETWIKIGDGLKWGGFLEYLIKGNIAAAERCDFVDARVRIPALEELREIAEST